MVTVGSLPAAVVTAPLSPPRICARWAVVAVGCGALAALSLLATDQTTYDPTAWLIWGREIVHGELSTTGGPSWKPLPILVTAPAALLGDAAAQQVWLVVARTGGVVALVLAFVWLGGSAARRPASSRRPRWCSQAVRDARPPRRLRGAARGARPGRGGG